MRVFVLLVCVLTFCGSAVAEPESYFFDQIHKANRDARPGRAHFSDLREIIGRRVVDETNRVIGEIDDVVMNDRGTIENIVLDINGQGHVPLHPRNLRPFSESALQLAFHRDDIGRYVAEIEPAAGDAGRLRGRDILGARIVGVSGERFGTVQDAFLNETGTNVIAVTVRGSKSHVGNLVLPVNRGMRTGPGRIVLLNSAYSAALNAYLRD